MCGASLARIFVRRGFRHGLCTHCGSVQKLVSEGEYRMLDVTYDPGALVDGVDQETADDVFELKKKKKLLEKYAADRIGQRLKFLDIGCGHGEYLMAGLQLGWSCVGVEPSAEHSEVGRRLFDLRIINDFFRPELFQSTKFDLVLVNHVIEHIFDVRQFLRDVAKVLERNGRIVLVTPNAASLAAAISGHCWTMLKPPDHVTMMTPAAFEILRSDGFTLQTYTTEFSWEIAATVLQAFRDFLRERSASADQEPPQVSGTRLRARARRRRLKYVLGGLSFISWPLHAIAQISDRQACLVAILGRAE